MRIPAKDFWRYSLREWNTALDGFIQSRGGEGRPDTMDRNTLEELMEKYPDGPRDPT